MNLNIKISRTILEFGKDLILALPDNCSKQEMEATMLLIVAIWNSVVIDRWNNDNKLEIELIARMSGEPREMVIIVKRLIRRKKKQFSQDLRAVGNHWIREENGELIFGCEARLDLDKAINDGILH